MFWDTKDPPSHNIEVLLETPDAKVELFLDEDNIIQECKTKKNIVNYFTRPDVIRRLVELITTEPPEDLPMAKRFRHANVACEILTMGLPSLDEKLLADTVTLQLLYSYLENEPPLNPLLASFFSKTLSTLFTKKSDQDWFLYQQMCLKLLEYLKMQKNFLDLICKHFSTPIVPDLLIEMMRNVEGGQLTKNFYEWLNEERLVERLIEIIGDPEQSEKHANVAEFLCDLIDEGRTMRQTEHENFRFEPTLEGSNPILKNIESAATLFALFNVILQPNALESTIVYGLTVVLKIIKPVKMTDVRNLDCLKLIENCEKQIHDELITTVIRVVEPQIKLFSELLRNSPKKPDIVTTAANLSPPFGMTRLQICRLFTVLLQTNNEEIAKAICETDFLDILLSLFKEYCWNNFLHCEVEKCLQAIFCSSLSNNNSSTNNNSTNKNKDYGLEQILFQPFDCKNLLEELSFTSKSAHENEEDKKEKVINNEEEIPQSSETAEQLNSSEENEGDTTKLPDRIPSAIQSHVIVNCKIVSKLIECWKINKDVESIGKGRRLGYMGHLIKIFKHITNCISESKHIGALIESNFKDDEERNLWQSIVNTTDGDLTKALNSQSKLLANCEPCDYNASLDFFTDNDISDAFNGLCTLMDSSDAQDVIFTLDYNTQQDDQDFEDDDGEDDYKNISIDNNEGTEKNQQNDDVKNALNLFQFGRSNEDEENEEDENTATGEGHSIYAQPSSLLTSFMETSDPWGNTNDGFGALKVSTTSVPWTTDFPSDNFADFDAHFSSFTNDMGESLTATTTENENVNSFNKTPSNCSTLTTNQTSSEEYDNNANVEKISWGGNFTSFQIPKKDTQYTRNFIDDYEDDEGMWTKPLGGCVITAAIENSRSSKPLYKSDQSEASNGPSMSEFIDEIHERTTINQLNNLIEENALDCQFAESITLNVNKDHDQIEEVINEINKEHETTSKHKLNKPNTNSTTENIINQLANTTANADENLEGSTTATTT